MILEIVNETCNNFDHYCNDFGLWGEGGRRGIEGGGRDIWRRSMKRNDKKRQISDEEFRRSVKVISIGYTTEEEAENAFDRVIEEIEEGEIEEVGGIIEVDCSNRLNQCKECALAGKWHQVQTKNCKEFDGCEGGGERGGEGEEEEVSVRTVVEFRGEDEGGEDEGLFVKQYWEFEGGLECRGTWEGLYRFYSGVSECDARVEVGGGTCEMWCEEGVGERERGMVCQRGNLPLKNEFSELDFITFTCNTVVIQGGKWREGPGISQILEDDSDSAGGERGVSVGLVVAAILGSIFFGGRNEVQ